MLVYEGLAQVLETEEGEGVSCGAVEESPSARFVIEPVTPHIGWGYRLAKRGLDLVFSLVVGLVALLPMLILAVLIRLDSKGPAIYKQERLGKGGRVFAIYKFRTMREDAEAAGPQWAQAGDERCTRLGRILRKCHLDELPQVINILRGDMSLVGPRPERPYFYEEFEQYIHGFRHRLSVVPGLTGLAQTSGGYDLKPEEKIVYDMEYIRTCSFWLDVKLILKTVLSLFGDRSAH